MFPAESPASVVMPYCNVVTRILRLILILGPGKAAHVGAHDDLHAFTQLPVRTRAAQSAPASAHAAPRQDVHPTVTVGPSTRCLRTITSISESVSRRRARSS